MPPNTAEKLAPLVTERDLGKVQQILGNTKVEGDDCLVWQGLTNQNNVTGKGGYGVVKFQGRQVGAHRAIYQALHGVRLAREQFVCHSCDNKPCVNPAHLWLGSNSENILDLVAKGKYVPRHVVNRKTTVEQRAEIAARYVRHSGKSSNAKALAAEYGITHSRVRQIVAAAKNEVAA